MELWDDEVNWFKGFFSSYGVEKGLGREQL